MSWQYNALFYSERATMLYAIVIDLDLDKLLPHYPDASQGNVWDSIERVLAPLGFARRYDSMYVGDGRVDAITCVLASQLLRREFVWFKDVVQQLHMLRIDDVADLMRAL